MNEICTMRGVENVINCDDVEWTSSSLPQGTSRSINPRPCTVNNVRFKLINLWRYKLNKWPKKILVSGSKCSLPAKNRHFPHELTHH